jgi:hypothetical protein
MVDSYVAGAGPLSLNRAGSINAPSRPRTLRSQPRRGCASKKRSRSLTITRPSGSIRKTPAFFNRGVASLAKGSVADAQPDFAQANELNPKYAYAALWLDIAERCNRLPSGLAELSAKLDMTAWPAPVVRHFMGEIDLAVLLAAASDPNPVKAKGNVRGAFLWRRTDPAQRRQGRRGAIFPPRGIFYGTTGSECGIADARRHGMSTARPKAAAAGWAGAFRAQRPSGRAQSRFPLQSPTIVHM